MSNRFIKGFDMTNGNPLPSKDEVINSLNDLIELHHTQQHSEDELKQIEKDLASSFEYWGSTQPQVFFGRTNAASMTAAQQFIERLCAYFDRQNRDREQRLIKEAELKTKIEIAEFLYTQANNRHKEDSVYNFDAFIEDTRTYVESLKALQEGEK